VAALIAGRDGVAPQARVLPAKLNGGSADAEAAIRWAADRPPVTTGVLAPALV
jgi:hypothetical protein